MGIVIAGAKDENASDNQQSYHPKSKQLPKADLQKGADDGKQRGIALPERQRDLRYGTCEQGYLGG
jgi:hypothetical protein